MPLPRILEPEVMDSAGDAAEYVLGYALVALLLYAWGGLLRWQDVRPLENEPAAH